MGIVTVALAFALGLIVGGLVVFVGMVRILGETIGRTVKEVRKQESAGRLTAFTPRSD